MINNCPYLCCVVSLQFAGSSSNVTISWHPQVLLPHCCVQVQTSLVLRVYPGSACASRKSTKHVIGGEDIHRGGYLSVPEQHEVRECRRAWGGWQCCPVCVSSVCNVSGTSPYMLLLHTLITLYSLFMFTHPPPHPLPSLAPSEVTAPLICSTCGSLC